MAEASPAIGAQAILRYRAGSSHSLAQYMRSDELRRLKFFEGLNPAFVSRVLDEVEFAFFLPGQNILQEGDEESSCYILNRGEVTVIVGGNEVATLTDGSLFGEICLLGLSSRRTATIVAKSFCDIRVLRQDRFRACFQGKAFSKEREHFRKIAKQRQQELEKINPPVPVPVRRVNPLRRSKSNAEAFKSHDNVQEEKGSLRQTFHRAHSASISNIAGDAMKSVEEGPNGRSCTGTLEPLSLYSTSTTNKFEPTLQAPEDDGISACSDLSHRESEMDGEDEKPAELEMHNESVGSTASLMSSNSPQSPASPVVPKCSDVLQRQDRESIRICAAVSLDKPQDGDKNLSVPAIDSFQFLQNLRGSQVDSPDSLPRRRSTGSTGSYGQSADPSSTKSIPTLSVLSRSRVGAEESGTSYSGQSQLLRATYPGQSQLLRRRSSGMRGVASSVSFEDIRTPTKRMQPFSCSDLPPKELLTNARPVFAQFPVTPLDQIYVSKHKDSSEAADQPSLPRV
jgi:hypothetical protein